MAAVVCPQRPDKKSYRRWKVAMEECHRIRREKGWMLWVYRCKGCQQLHLGNRKERAEVIAPPARPGSPSRYANRPRRLRR